MPEPPRKRRPVRKGTRNCWECKRRKVRCTFVSPTSAACDNCTERKTTCVSQEFEVESVPNTLQFPAQLEERLLRVEHLLERLLDRGESGPSTVALLSEDSNALSHHTNDPFAVSGLPTPSPNTHSLFNSPISVDQYDGILKQLIAIWPDSSDLAYIHNLPTSLSTHLHMRSSTLSPGSSLREVLQLPPPGSHVTLVAHKLLVLASLLQGTLAMTDLPMERQQRFERLLSTITNTIARLVTNNDELTSSVEGAECIMMEAMIQNHAGKLHQAWRTVRRAVTVGQVLGLHRNVPISAERFLDPRTQSQFDLEQFCFQIVSMDRYLSTTLGLPYASGVPYATAPDQLALLAPIDRMGRLQCIISERLFDRSKHSVDEVSDIDHLLLEAAAQMPDHWWLIPDSRRTSDDDPDQDRVIARFNYQLSHYHLLLRLHLPYVFQPEPDTHQGHGKRIALNASREIISRYLGFRAWNTGRYYCRGMDFLALIALTVLCVVHIDSRAQRATSTSLVRSPSELAHSHAVDRSMMQRTLEAMQGLDHDETASNLSKMMKSLLDVEEETALGMEYSTTAVYSGDGTAEYQSEILDEGRKLQLRIPFFGTVTLQRSLASTPVNGFDITDNFIVSDQSTVQTDLNWGDNGSQQQMAIYDDWTLQTVNQALFQDLFGGSGNC